ncbi:cysteine--tRNA ligase [Slackia heliotrinireducens]|uniref:Cysteine--tRNA ligase n=1 Tax=Slackia heliotrinireducens (strain ATCC 29202 / DSM 20476 / NCTC 11029 / RHS 1) TaxID=471855 RepID=C7N7S6_SLAHD|nr:cysteine--tRNA ligase [Slackia heliotrinireducens]ACV22961.1 cysteinyl-tRNA synthetase [Slackia heliotrinireducens DSM 20476]VEH01815.1 Cysteine--tRNA ligase [Slackia heliotrinireducens]
MIRLYDTQAHQKLDFVPNQEGVIHMYVCGPTVYNYIHIGNARTFISFDIIRRYLMWRGFDVTFVQNVTDVDDKIIKKANEEGRSAAEVATEYTDAFIEDMRAMGVLDPDVRPKATEEIDSMIELVSTLIERGHAYEVEGDVYFSVRSFPEYGKLSHRNIDELEGGHRELRADGQGLEDRKRDPLDFAVWKAAKPGEPSWPSPWGEGRPGWHIECSAMSRKYLGLPLDIHGGGADLAFPHHENEIAQSEAAYGVAFSNHWMHGGMLNINGEKMSKSLGNFLLLRDILKTVEPSVLRMFMARAHYRSPLDFNEERVAEAAASLERIVNFVERMDWLVSNPDGNAQPLSGDYSFEQGIEAVRAGFVEAMDDDFNTAGALGCIFTFVNDANAALGNATLNAEDASRIKAVRDTVVDLMGVFGISVEKAAGEEYPAEVIDLARDVAGYAGSDAAEAVEALLAARAQARKEKNWAVADGVRNGLNDLGFVIEDTPQGAKVSYKQ